MELCSLLCGYIISSEMEVDKKTFGFQWLIQHGLILSMKNWSLETLSPANPS